MTSFTCHCMWCVEQKPHPATHQTWKRTQYAKNLRIAECNICSHSVNEAQETKQKETE